MALRALLFTALAFVSGGCGVGSEVVRLGPLPDELASTPCQREYNRGLEALVGEEAEAAAQSLASAVEADPECRLPGRGLAAEWLGVAAEARGDTGRAMEVWAHALAAGGGADRAPIAARYLGVAGASGWGEVHPSQALDALTEADGAETPSRGVLNQALARVASVLPVSVRREGFRGGDWRSGVEDPEAIRAWWREQDPLPATPDNERAEEYVRRVALALRRYPAPRTVLGYDDRGELLVRFGPPIRSFQIPFNDADLAFELAQSGTRVTRSDFPDNEVWVYGSNTDARTYILVRDGDAFRIGTSQDLLPPSLRYLSGGGRRVNAQAAVAFAAMRHIYGKLATLETGYGTMWADLERLAGNGVFSGSAVSALRSLGQEMNSAEAGLHSRREEQEPPSTSTFIDEIGRLDVLVSPARFLTPDGRQSVEVWWAALPPQPILPPEAAFESALVQAPGTIGRVVLDSLGTTASGGGAARRVPARALVAVYDAEPQPLALQVDLRNGAARLGAFVWTGTTEPLRTGVLELSDIVATDPTDRRALVEERVTAGQPLSLRFEAYGLSTEAGPAAFTIEYEVVLREVGGGLLRRTRETAREGQLTSITEGSRTEQFLLLNTADWAEADEVDVTVRVRDLQTGAEVERAVRLEVVR